MYELLIAHGESVFQPAVLDGIQWTTERKGSPSKLAFTVVQDSVLQMEEGDAVRLMVDEQEVFFGFIFTIKRTKSSEVSVTAYDQLRYLKNKDTYVYEGKTASEVIQMIAGDFSLNTGTLEATKYVIPSRVEDNSTLFDIIQNALDLELQNAGEMYVLYDDFGKITLKNIASMYVGILINDETAQNFNYQSSIDSDVYNQIKLVRDNKETGKRDVWMTKDSANINQWGVLQYFESIQEGENGQAKADSLLNLYNQKTRTLKVTDAFGDVRCRAGCLIAVQLDIADLTVNNFMLIEKATHTFKKDEHLMSLNLRGGLINGQ